MIIALMKIQEHFRYSKYQPKPKKQKNGIQRSEATRLAKETNKPS